MELAIHRSLANIQRVIALADTSAECRLVYGKPEQFPVIVHTLMAVAARWLR